MANPYLTNAGMDATSGGDKEKYPFRKWGAIGVVNQGVVIGQSPWLPNRFEPGETMRIISLQNGEEKFSIVIDKKSKKIALGRALDDAGLDDTRVGDLVAMERTADVDTGKPYPAQTFKAVVKRP